MGELVNMANNGFIQSECFTVAKMRFQGASDRNLPDSTFIFVRTLELVGLLLCACGFGVFFGVVFFFLPFLKPNEETSARVLQVAVQCLLKPC